MELVKDLVTSVVVRMYRPGTGDFFLLTFKSADKVCFRMMVDCGCIYGSAEIFAPLVTDLVSESGKVIDLLVVTHEHADHISGFGLASDLFAQIEFKKVWFAWTEDKADAKANNYRAGNTKMKFALEKVAAGLKNFRDDGYYERMYGDSLLGADHLNAQYHFIDGISSLAALNLPVEGAANALETMEDKLRAWQVIKEKTVVEFLSPGKLVQGLEGLTGISIFVLGPPRDYAYLRMEEKDGETFEKRKQRSTVDMSFVNAITADLGGALPSSSFDSRFEMDKDKGNVLTANYKDARHAWRNIDNDWLYSAGSLALRLQSCINNTSLALAIRFDGSERVLLFPGDAEFGSWLSWHEGLQWKLQRDGKEQIVNMPYLLSKTVFYKVSHHLSQNGTPDGKGLAMMTQPELVTMATLDLNKKKIMAGWRNTMPNDFIGAALIGRAKGYFYVTGDRKQVVGNIKTERVSVSAADMAAIDGRNLQFDGTGFVECEVMGA